MNDKLLTRLVLASALVAPALHAQTAEPAPSPPSTQAQTLTALDVVTAAARNSPSLHIALLQETQANYAVEAEDALYVPVFDANTSYTRTRSPSARGGATSVTTTDTYDLGAGITKTFALGTTLSATVDGKRNVQSNPASGLAGAAAVTAPQYNLTGKLALTQPLLRGYGTDLGLATLRQAKLSRTAAVLATRQAASQILHDALTNYWELWYADEAVRINIASRDLSKTQQEQATEQVKSGALAPADAYQYATALAQLEQQVVSAAMTRRQKSLTLAQAMGDENAVSADLSASDAPMLVLPIDDARQAVNDAITNSYSLKQQEAQIAIAKDQARIAGDPLRPRLDLDAYVASAGLGNGQISPAAEQFGQGQALSAHVGLTYEMPLTDTRRSAQIAGALLSAHIAEKQLEALRFQLKSDVQVAIVDIESAGKGVELAQRTEQVAQAQVDAEKSRFMSGTALAIEVAQAVDSLRRAQLSVQRARVDLAEAELDLLNLRGRLLERYTDVLKRFAPSTIAIEGATGPM
ncbi:MAG TPA: TolC family protein [Polyangiaceae bacterium]|jgi:outer membrane protein TolC